jgi:phosphate-selective porin OprO and OprP
MRCQGWQAIGLLAFAMSPVAARAQQADATAVAVQRAELSSNDKSTERLPELATQSSTGDRSAVVDAPNVAEILRRLQATEAELEQLRVESQRRSAPAKRLAWPASLQSGTEDKGVEDRIATLEKQAGDNVSKLPLVRLSGFIQLDTGLFSQDAASTATLGDIQNGTDFRRARLQALGKVTEFTNFSIELDFAAPGRPSFKDVWGEQTNLPIGNIRIGQYRMPVTMDSWTSVRHLEFLERSAPFIAFDPFRRVGLMDWYVTESGRTLFATSVFSTGWTFWNTATGTTEYNTLGGDDRFGTQIGDNGGVGVATRMSHLLYYDEPADGRYLMHVGGGYTFASIGGNGVGAPGFTGGQTYRASSVPEFFVGDPGGNFSTFAGTPNVLDTGRFLATNYSLYHTEFAANAGSFHFQSEALGTAVAQLGGPLVYYGGAYAQCGFFLTGESAGYNKQMGAMDYNCQPFREFMALGPGKPMCGWGAWELAARWSYLDLQTNRVTAANYTGAGTTLPALAPTSPAGPSAATNPNPGSMNESTLALNWYWNQYTKVQFNWIHNMLSSQYHGYSQLDAWTARYQVEF